jgi:HD-GYP domain-containing protein (c-di-GMP phosphodiesterase class II)
VTHGDRAPFFFNAMNRTIAIRAYVFVVSAAAAVAVEAGLAFGVPAVGLMSLLSLTGLAFGLEYGGATISAQARGSVAFIVQIAVAILYGPTWGAAVSAFVVLLSQMLLRRDPLKVVFNVAQRVLAISVATQTYALLGGAIPFGTIEADGLQFAILSLFFFAINSLAVSGAISISTGKRFGEVWTGITKVPFFLDVAASFAAVLVAWAFTRFGPTGIVGVAVPVVVIRSVYLMYHRLEAQSREMLELMVKAIEARDPYTSGHSVRVAAISRVIATEMKLTYELVDQIATAALLHDVGKIHEKFAPLLRKQAALTPEEAAVLQEHPVKSAELVGVLSSFRGTVLDSVRGHHERWDGNGYPDRLAGGAIPLGARIITIADTVDAMRTDRPYRPAASYEQTVAELERCRGTQFDPAIIDVALTSMVVRSMIAAPQDVRGLPESAPLPVESSKRRSSGWMRVLR